MASIYWHNELTAISSFWLAIAAHALPFSVDASEGAADGLQFVEVCPLLRVLIPERPVRFRPDPAASRRQLRVQAWHFRRAFLFSKQDIRQLFQEPICLTGK